MLDVRGVLSVALSLARLRVRPPPPMISVLVRALIVVMPAVGVEQQGRGETRRLVYGAKFGHLVSVDVCY